MKKKTAKNWKNKCRIKIKERLKVAEKEKKQVSEAKKNEKKMTELIAQGNSCFKIKDYDCAASKYYKALKLNKKNINLTTKLSSCYSKLKNFNQAYKITKELTVLDSLNYIHHYYLSKYALYNNDYKSAIKAGRRSLLLEEKQNWVISYIAIGYILNNEYKKAEKIYKKYRNSHIGGFLNLAKDGFFNDIIRLEKAGIKHPDFEKAKDLLNPHR